MSLMTLDVWTVVISNSEEQQRVKTHYHLFNIKDVSSQDQFNEQVV